MNNNWITKRLVHHFMPCEKDLAICKYLAPINYKLDILSCHTLIF